jgi:hypothetical protein
MVGNIRKWCNLWGSNWGLMDVDGNLMYSVIWWWLRREHHEDHELDAVVMFAAQILICTFPPGNKICINCVYVCQLVLISPWPHSKEGWADMTNDSSRWLVSVVWCVCVCHLQVLRSLIGHTWLELRPSAEVRSGESTGNESKYLKGPAHDGELLLSNSAKCLP